VNRPWATLCLVCGHDCDRGPDGMCEGCRAERKAWLDAEHTYSCTCSHCERWIASDRVRASILTQALDLALQLQEIGS